MLVSDIARELNGGKRFYRLNSPCSVSKDEVWHLHLLHQRISTMLSTKSNYHLATYDRYKHLKYQSMLVLISVGTHLEECTGICNTYWGF